MVTQDTINRINELYHKSKAEGLTPEETEEQKALRREYIDSVKRNLRNNLNNITLVNPDGSYTELSEEYVRRKKLH